MRYNLIDTVGLAAGTANLYNNGVYPVLSLTSAGIASPAIHLARATSFSVVFLGVNGSTAGTGTISAQLQVSNDNKNWINLGTALTIVPGTAIGTAIDHPAYHFIRTSLSGLTAGTVAVTSQIIVKSDSYQ